MEWLKKLLAVFSSIDPSQLSEALRLIGELKDDFEAIKVDILDLIDVVKIIWGADGTMMRTMEDVEAQGILNGKPGPFRELIKYLIEHPEVLEPILKLLPVIIPLLTGLKQQN